MIKNIIFDFGGVLVDWNPHYLFDSYFNDKEETEWFVKTVVSSEWNAEMDGGKPFDVAVKERILLFPDYKEAIELYKKYISIPTGGLAFPKKSNQKMNKNIKEIAKMLGFTREVEVMQYCGKKPIYRTAPLCDVIGTHAARRTFVVHALEEGMSPEMVMTFTGHNDYDTMKPYIALTDKTRQNALLNSFKMS